MKTAVVPTVVLIFATVVVAGQTPNTMPGRATAECPDGSGWDANGWEGTRDQNAQRQAGCILSLGVGAGHCGPIGLLVELGASQKLEQLSRGCDQPSNNALLQTLPTNVRGHRC